MHSLAGLTQPATLLLDQSCSRAALARNTLTKPHLVIGAQRKQMSPDHVVLRRIINLTTRSSTIRRPASLLQCHRARGPCLGRLPIALHLATARQAPSECQSPESGERLTDVAGRRYQLRRAKAPPRRIVPTTRFENVAEPQPWPTGSPMSRLHRLRRFYQSHESRCVQP